MKKNAFYTSAALMVIFLAGCTAPVPPPAPEPAPPEPPAPEVLAAQQLFEQGKVQDSIVACVDIARKNPQARGLTDLQARINQKLAEERIEAAKKKGATSVKLNEADAERYRAMPESYKQQKHVFGEEGSLKQAPSAMQQVLSKPISIHLQNADLSSIVAQIGQSQNINMIADSSLSDSEKTLTIHNILPTLAREPTSLSDSKKTLTIHAENTPLSEILEYIGRNMSVNFSVGQNLIWVTPKEEETTGLPLETRVYRLRKGMLGSELGKTAHGESIFKGPEERGRTTSSSNNEKKDDGEQKQGAIGLLDSIERFVPQPEGADYLFNDKAHVLIVKNTRENLTKVEDLIDALDIRPLQVLIEARFVTTRVNDLKQLGIDWLVDNRGGSRFSTTENGANTLASSAQFKHDALVGTASEVTTDSAGKVTSGGLSLAYQFLLGDTALQAVLHAIQQNGESQTIVVPRVTTINNREAKFRVGEDISYFERVDANITTSGSSYSGSNERDNMTFDYDTPMTLEVGYSLAVTPSVGADLSSINLVLRPEISSVAEWMEYKIAYSSVQNSEIPTLKIPSVSRQYIETEAVVRSGETVVLGGLVNSTKSKDETHTPWLSRLPLIGKLFQMEDKTKTSENVLVFVTATLVSDVGEELIPLNQFQRYGEEVPPEAKVPDVLKPPAEAEAAPAIEAEPPAGAAAPANNAAAPAAAAPADAAAVPPPAAAAPAAAPKPAAAPAAAAG